MTTRGYGDRWWEESKPADLEKTNTASAAKAASTSKDSYTKTIKMTLVKGKKYKFYFQYKHEDPDTKEVKLSESSPVWIESFDIPNLTKAVQNLTLTAGSQSYGVKFNLDPLSVQEDVVIFESLTSNFASQSIVYVGTSTNVSILTTGVNAFAPRWIKVRSRDRWDDLNISEVTAGPVTPFSADVDTTYTVENPASTSANASIDPKDLSGFSLVSTINWVQSTNIKTAGYAIRWSTDNPASVPTPLWEYASVSGIATTSFTATGLIPNTTYYYQVASTTPYDVVNWTGSASGTFIASDADGTAAGALARLKSFIAIGGASQDLFKIGTGISQSINLNTDPLANPTLTAGTYHGIVLNKSTTNVGNNFWLTTGQFRVGNPTEFMYWNGTNLYLTGNINATGGRFTGNVQLAIPTGGTTSGTLYAGANPTSGARVRLSSEGIFAYNSTSTDNTTGLTFSLQQATGQIDARSGTVGGWTLATTGFSSANTKIENSGNISLGVSSTATLESIVRLSADDATYRLWIGSQTASNAPFRVTKEGTLYAQNAVIGLAAGSSVAGYATEASLANYASNASLANYATVASLANYVTNGGLTTTLNSYSTAQQIAASYLPTTSFDKAAVVSLLSKASGAVAGKIDGGLLQTGTVIADAVVTDYVYTGVLTGNIIRTQVSTTFPRISLNEVSNRLTFHTNSGVSPGSIYGDGDTTYGRLRLEAPRPSGYEAASIQMYTLNNTTTTIIFTSDLASFSQGALFGSGIFATSGTSYFNKLDIGSTIYANTLGTTSSNGQGAIYQDSSGFLKVRTGTGSSIKLKDNVAPFASVSNYSNIINNMNLVTFNYKPEVVEDPWFNQLGMIVEDLVQHTDNEFLIQYKNDEPVGIYYEKIPLFLVGAFKEMTSKINEMQSRLDALEA
jgi:hypothetical protein